MIASSTPQTFLNIDIPFNTNLFPVLGVGAELKNRFCILCNGKASLSNPIGNLSDSEALSLFENSIRKYESSLPAKTEIIVHDLHPDYLSTQWAKDQKNNAVLVPVQHHHAHIASVCAEYHLNEPVIGIAFDGTGLGTDHTIWGGEFLVVNGSRFQRMGHLRSFPLMGGDKAIFEIWRSAYGILTEMSGSEIASEYLPLSMKKNRSDLEKMIKDKRYSPLCSSMGRLFDASSSLMTGKESVSYEAQAAMELESMANSESENSHDFYPVEIVEKDEKIILDPAPMLNSILKDRTDGIKTNVMAIQFHNTIVHAMNSAVNLISKKTGIKTIALSGGCFQNKILLQSSIKTLTQSGFQVYVNEKIPCHDGGIALGQVWIAAQMAGENHVFSN